MKTIEEEEIELQKELSAKYGEVLNTKEATAKYDFLGFCAPFVVVRRKSDGVKGSLTFTHMPRLYYNFMEE